MDNQVLTLKDLDGGLRVSRSNAHSAYQDRASLSGTDALHARSAIGSVASSSSSSGPGLSSSMSGSKIMAATEGISQRVKLFTSALEETTTKKNETFSAIESELRKNLISVRDAFQTEGYVVDQTLKSVNESVNNSLEILRAEVDKRLQKFEDAFITKASELRNRLNSVASKSEKISAEKIYEKSLNEKVVVPYNNAIRVVEAEFLQLKTDTISCCTKLENEMPAGDLSAAFGVAVADYTKPATTDSSKSKSAGTLLTVNAKLANSFTIGKANIDAQLNLAASRREKEVNRLKEQLESTFKNVHDEISAVMSFYREGLDNIKYRVAAEIKMRNTNEEQIISAMDQVSSKIQEDIAALVEKRKKERHESIESLSALGKLSSSKANAFDYILSQESQRKNTQLGKAGPSSDSDGNNNNFNSSYDYGNSDIRGKTPSNIAARADNEMASTIGAIQKQIAEEENNNVTGISQFGVSLYDDF